MRLLLRWFAVGLAFAVMACSGARGSEPVVAEGEQGEQPEAANEEGGSDSFGQADARSDWRWHREAELPVSELDPMWGSPLAPVTLVEFADLECPFSARVDPTIETLQEHYGPEKLRIVWKHNPLPFHKQAEPAAEAASVIHDLLGSRAFWKFKDLAFANRTDLTRDNFIEWARQLGADPREFEAGLEDFRHAGKVAKDMQLARAVGAHGTPEFRINGVALKGAQPVEEFVRIIDIQLKEAQALLDAGTPPKDIYPQLVAKNLKLTPVKEREEHKPEPPDTTVWAIPVKADDPKKGGTAPLVTIVQFAEFQCPFCKRVAPNLDVLLDKYGDDVQLVWKDNPLDFHPRALPAARVARAAYQSKGAAGFWKAHDALFDTQPNLEDSDLVRAAETSGAPKWKLESALTSTQYDAKFEESMDLAHDFSARGTPHFFINGQRVKGAQPLEVFEKVIDEQLEKARALVATGVPRRNVYKKIFESGEPAPPPPKKELGPVPADAPFKGAANAKVVIQIFAQFQCPFCKRALPTIDEVLSNHKNVKYVWRHLPLPFHKEAPLAAEAAIEVHRQKGNQAFWAYHDKLFEEQSSRGLARPELETYAAELGGIDMNQFRAALDKRTHKARVDADIEAAKKAGIAGTPGFVVNDYFLSGAQPYKVFKRTIRLAEGR